jgi:hypothetical protein
MKLVDISLRPAWWIECVKHYEIKYCGGLFEEWQENWQEQFKTEFNIEIIDSEAFSFIGFKDEDYEWFRLSQQLGGIESEVMNNG